MRLDDAENFVVANGLAGVIDIEDVGVEGRALIWHVNNVGEIEDEQGTRIFVGRFLSEQDGAIDFSAGRDKELAILAGNIFPSLAERIRNGGFDGIARAGTIAIHGRLKAKAESKSGREIRVWRGGKSTQVRCASRAFVRGLEILIRGGEEAAGGAVLDEECLNFEAGGVNQVIESGVLIHVFTVDVHA